VVILVETEDKAISRVAFLNRDLLGLGPQDFGVLEGPDLDEVHAFGKGQMVKFPVELGPGRARVYQFESRGPNDDGAGLPAKTASVERRGRVADDADLRAEMATVLRGEGEPPSPAEKIHDEWVTLDLSPYANLDLTSPRKPEWQGLRRMPRGLVEWNGTPYRLPDSEEAAGIALWGGARPGEGVKRVEGIPVGLSGMREIRIVHAAASVPTAPTPAYRLLLNYADGLDAVCPVVAPDDLPGAIENAVGPRTRVLWGEDRPDAPTLFSLTIANPRPEKKVVSIDIESYESDVTSLILAITVRVTP
jgi:hypothetical protein